MYFPHEPKTGILRVFPVLAEIYKKEKKPKLGLFPLKIQTLPFPVSSMEDTRGGEFIHLPCCSCTILSLTCCPERKTIGIPPPGSRCPPRCHGSWCLRVCCWRSGNDALACCREPDKTRHTNLIHLGSPPCQHPKLERFCWHKNFCWVNA